MSTASLIRPAATTAGPIGGVELAAAVRAECSGDVLTRDDASFPAAAFGIDPSGAQPEVVVIAARARRCRGDRPAGQPGRPTGGPRSRGRPVRTGGSGRFTDRADRHPTLGPGADRSVEPHGPGRRRGVLAAGPAGRRGVRIHGGERAGSRDRRARRPPRRAAGGGRSRVLARSHPPARGGHPARGPDRSRTHDRPDRLPRAASQAAGVRHGDRDDDRAVPDRSGVFGWDLVRRRRRRPCCATGGL